MSPRLGLRLLAAVVSLVLLGSAGPASAGVPVAATPRAGWGTDGTVYAVLVTGDTVVVGGSFTVAVSPTGATTPRANLAAFSLSTGALLTGWRADAVGTVRALATDGSRLWAGGDLTSVAGQTRRGLAALRLADGAVDPAFSVSLTGGGVRALEVKGAALYAGGSFTTVNGATGRGRLVKLDATTGAVDTRFTVTADNEVRGLASVATSSRLYVAGRFTTVNNTARVGLTAVDAATGAVVSPGFSGSTPALALDVNADGTRVVTGQVDNRAAAYSTSSGRRLWTVTADGDVQAVRYAGDRVLAGFHDGFGGDTTRKVVAVGASDGVVDTTWSPTVDTFHGVWSIDAAAGGVVLGGTFGRVAGVAAPRVAFFRP